MIKQLSVTCCLCILLLFLFSATIAQTNTNSVILLNEGKLALLKKQYQNGDASIIKEVAALCSDADQALTAGPFSVTLHKTKVAPSGDVHDYVSQAPYWWPDPAKPDGKPYIRRDGERNPEIRLIHDDSQMGKMTQSVKILSFAWYFTGKEQYAKKAVELLNTWFVTPETRMNPNLNYGQYIAGVNDGRGIGIIESRGLVAIPDALALMQTSKSLNDDAKQGIKKWFTEYLNWLQNSKNGFAEQAQINNHGTNYDVQVVDFAIYTGDIKLARTIIQKQTIPRIAKQFTVEGMQPLELARTKSWSYSSMNLEAWCRLAVMAEGLNIDLWHTTTKGGRGIEKCISWMLPYVLKENQWTYKQIEPINNDGMFLICNLAAGKYTDLDLEKVFKMYPQPKLWMVN